MRRNQHDLFLVLPDLAQGLCKKAHWGKRILLHQSVCAECAIGQGVKQVAMGLNVGGK